MSINPHQEPVINTGTRDSLRLAWYSPYHPTSALPQLRLLSPARQLGIPVIHGVEQGQIFVDRVSQADIVILQRDFPRHYVEYQQVIELAHAKRIPIIYDMDDLLFELPEDHPDRAIHYYTEALFPMLQALLEADLLTVSTLPLQEYLQPFNRNIAILPNFLDDSSWQLRAPISRTTQDKPLIIGYMGSTSHTPDLNYVAPVLRKVIDHSAENIQLKFWGIQPPQEIAGSPGVSWVPIENHVYDYAEFAQYFLGREVDIFICPLVENLFNSCKSAVKFLEYSALGVPGVYSRIAPYQRVIHQGVNGFLASSLEEWEECLVKLIENPSLRHSIATNAQKTIRDEWLLSNNATRWLQVFQEAPIKSNGKDNQEHQTLLSLLISSIPQTRHEYKQLREHNQQLRAQLEHISADLHVQSAGQLQELQSQLDQQISANIDLRSQIESLSNDRQTLEQYLNYRLYQAIDSREYRHGAELVKLIDRLAPIGSIRKKLLSFLYNLRPTRK